MFRQLVTWVGEVRDNLRRMTGPGEQHKQPAHYDQGFSVASYNLQAHEKPEAVEAAAVVIRAVNADIMALQEITQAAKAHFETALHDLYPHMALYPATGSDDYSGQAVLSRFAIESQDYWQETMGHLYVRLTVEGRTLHLMNAHPAAPADEDTEQRSREIDHVLQYIEAHTGPIILLGDMNMSEWEADYNHVTGQFQDTFDAAQPKRRATFPDNFKEIPFIPSALAAPVVRLDYIFFNNQLRCLAADTWPNSGSSDHRPVWAVFEIAD